MSAKKDEDSLVLEEDEDELSETFTCKYCDFHTTNIDELDDHIISHDEAILEDNNDECEADTFTDESTTKVSPQNSRKSKKKQIEFSVKPPKIRRNFVNHDSDDIVNKTILVCPYCSMQTTKKIDMTQHLLEHRSPVEVPIYVCSECPYATRRKCDMPKHLLTHCKDGNVPMYKCPHCTYATKRKGDLPKHLLCHRKPNPDELFSCNQCPYATKRTGDLKKHILSHESDSYLSKDRSTYNCTECGYTSRRLNDLHKHVVLHCDKLVTGVLKCVKCDYATTISNHFAKHVLSSCKSREEAVTMREYIVLEEDDLHFYELEKGNEKSGDRAQILKGNVKKRRKLGGGNTYVSPKRSAVPNKLYATDSEETKNENQEGEEITGEQSGTDKVVVLASFDEGESPSDQ